MFEAYIGSNGHGMLTAKFGNIVVDLEDAGLSHKFCYGECIYLWEEPQDRWELIDILKSM